jgi:hypothetical protein
MAARAKYMEKKNGVPPIETPLIKTAVARPS